MTEESPPDPWETRRVAAFRAFSPSAPISQRDLLAGRREQLDQMLSVLAADGRHLLLFGERGVGKTSLARVMAAITNAVYLSAYVTCDSDDTFESVWKRILNEVRFVSEHQAVGVTGEIREVVTSALEMVGGATSSPNQIRDALRLISRGLPVVVFIDEFDRLRDSQVRVQFADLIKLLSDYSVPATLCLVGVADDVSDLILEHESIERNIEQILTPRMSADELVDIVNGASQNLDMQVDADAARRVAELSQGLPHYTHLLGQHAAIAAINRKSTEISGADVETGVAASLRAVQQSITDKYVEAIASSQKNMFPEVILACAVAPRNEQGYFTQPDVREPLSQIMGRPMEIPAYARHLSDLCEEKRGPILVRRGRERRYRYRFANPLMQPFVTMKGMADGKLPASPADNSVE